MRIILVVVDIKISFHETFQSMTFQSQNIFRVYFKAHKMLLNFIHLVSSRMMELLSESMRKILMS